jgi:hypothetical protein
MNALKKSHVKNRRSFGLGKGLPAPSPLIRSGRAGCSMINPEVARRTPTRFGDDFYEEHSLAKASVVLTAIPNCSNSVEPPKRRCQNPVKKIDLPNCVYVG